MNRKNVLHWQFLTSTISTTMVLLLLGTLVLFVLTAKEIRDYVHQDLTVTVVMADGTTPTAAHELEQQISEREYIHHITYISSEQALQEQVEAMGIDPSRLWMEDQATSTWENLNFSLDMIEEKTGQRPEELGVLSSEYHLFRASLFADACGVEFLGIPAKTTKLSLRVNYFMREVAGVWHYLLLGGQYDA